MYTLAPRDIYKCIKCKDWVSYGDRFCKHCGHHYSPHEAQEMKKGASILQIVRRQMIFLRPKDLLFNMYECKKCSEKISYGDQYCKYCGKKFTQEDVSAMLGANKSDAVSTFKISIISFIVLIVVFGLLASSLL